MQLVDTAHWKRNASLFVGGQLVSQFGSMLVQYAIIWHITLTTLSGTAMAVFSCAGMIPMALISPFAGIWADRFNRKYLINISDACIALVTLMLAIAFLLGMQNMWFMLVVVIVRSLGQGIQMPASGALVPQIVPEEHLMRFGALQGTIQSLNIFGAPLVAAALYAAMPIEYIFFIDVATAAVGISIVFFFVKVSGVPGAKGRTGGINSYVTEFIEGILLIFRTKWLGVLLVYSSVFSFFAAPAAMLTPLQVGISFQGGSWHLMGIELAFAGGMILGGIALSATGGFRNKVYTMIMACMLFGATTLLLGVVPLFLPLFDALVLFYVYLGFMLACGVGMPFFNTPVMTIMQTKIDPQIMGRVFSVSMTVGALTMPLGTALFGPLADFVAVEWILIACGLVIVASGLVLLRVPELIEAGEPVQDAAAGEAADAADAGLPVADAPAPPAGIIPPSPAEYPGSIISED
jgi:DHA3 family macrolide efflux protein-like MFS transporter